MNIFLEQNAVLLLNFSANFWITVRKPLKYLNCSIKMPWQTE